MPRGTLDSGDLRKALKKLPAEDVIAFEEQLRQHLERAFRWDLWGAAMLRNADECASVDGFVRFLRSVVACGRRTYTRALTNADSLVGHPTGPNEQLGPAVHDAYVAKTGKPPPRWRLARPAGKRWNIRNQRELAKRLPRMHALEAGFTLQMLFGEAVAYENRNDLSRANKIYRKAIASLHGAPHPGVPIGHGNLMVNEATLGALGKARKHLALAHATMKMLKPWHRAERANLEHQIAWFHWEHGPDSSLRDALALARRAQRSMSDPLIGMDTEMRILLRLGREADARAVAVRALAKNPRHPDFRDVKKRWKL